MSRLALIAGILTSFFAAFINIQFMFSAGKIAIAAIDGMFILFLAVALIFLPAKEKKMAQDFTAGFFIGLGLLPLIAFGLCCGAICFPSLLNLGK